MYCPAYSNRCEQRCIKSHTGKSSDLKAVLKKCVFKRRLKRLMSGTERKLEGRLFHSLAPATEKALSPKWSLVRGMSSSRVVADRRVEREGMFEIG